MAQEVEGALSQPRRQRELAEMAPFWGLRLIPERETAGRWSRKNLSGDRGARGAAQGGSRGFRKVGKQGN